MTSQAQDPQNSKAAYRGRLAPSPTGLLHIGHARTFWLAYQRALAHDGTLVLRNEDLDESRCKPEFVEAMIRDLKWLGVEWQEGPDVGGPFGPYNQSQRKPLYEAAFDQLCAAGVVYPCTCSRQDVLRALQAPHAGDDEPVYPGTCRPDPSAAASVISQSKIQNPKSKITNWRFRVAQGEPVHFVDGQFGPQEFVAGRDFGDFVVWRHDGSPSYQLAVVVDDAAMHITEVVRGADLLRSTARQLLLYRVLAWPPPSFFHCPLMTDSSGVRLAKRHDALSLAELRSQGVRPEQVQTASTQSLARGGL
jgi:glutamyl/glutaminyl-tRNA synthetase